MLKINKAKARKIFSGADNIYSKQDVLIVPCKMRPDNMWMPATKLDPRNIYTADCFNDIVAMFEYYNCCNECGRYAAFYLIEK